ncbi:MAG TPA: FIST N-terminal domain-containing protein [Alphaproteobacteria bacterium]
MTADGPQFALGHAAARGVPSTWGQLVFDCVAQLGDSAARANLGFVYVTDALAEHLSDIVAFLRRTTSIRDWIGSVGIGIAAADHEYFDVPAVALLAVTLPADAYCLIPNLSGGIDALGPARAWAKRMNPTLAVVHADPRAPDLVDTIETLARETVPFLVGGLSSSRGATDQVAGQVVRGGVSGVMFAPDLAVVTGLSQGCTPIGPTRTITDGAQNIVREIDGRPALDVLKEDIGDILARRLERIGGQIHAAFPVAGSDTGDYLVRNLVGIDPARGWLAVGAEVTPGEPILFVRRDPDAATRDLVRMLTNLKRRLPAPPRAGLYFSCLARGPNLFGPDSAELGILRRELGAFPLVGMFCNGEISNQRLYGYTGVLALFL